jgi:hypothetical protein
LNPPEYATGADEDRATYNTAHDEAYTAAEDLLGLIDDMVEPCVSPQQMIAINRAIAALVEEVKRISGKAV